MCRWSPRMVVRRSMRYSGCWRHTTRSRSFQKGRSARSTVASRGRSRCVARLALSTGAPVIPVGIGLDRARIHLIETLVDGAIEVGTWYFGGPYAMTVGEPLHFVVTQRIARWCVPRLGR